MRQIINREKDTASKQLLLIPKIEEYIEYMIKVIVKLPRTERFNIGNEYKMSMYQMMERAFYLNKLNRRENTKECFSIINQIDVKLNCQRIYLRIMKEESWIDKKKFDVAMQKIYEIGNIIGGLMKYYAKNH